MLRAHAATLSYHVSPSDQSLLPPLWMAQYSGVYWLPGVTDSARDAAISGEIKPRKYRVGDLRLTQAMLKRLTYQTKYT